MQHRVPGKGFTLVELAIVIGILGVLSAVALSNLGSSTAAAECTMIKDMKARLSAGAAQYLAAQGTLPANYEAFVTTTTTFQQDDTKKQTISLAAFSPGAAKGNPCAITGTIITCDGGTSAGCAKGEGKQFKVYTAKYTLSTGTGTTLLETDQPGGVPPCE